MSFLLNFFYLFDRRMNIYICFALEARALFKLKE